MRSYLESLESLSKNQLMLMLARKRQEETEGVAVVGMACRLPGGLDSPADFWAALQAGRVVPAETRAVPTDSLGRPRWNVEAPDLAPLADLLAKGAYLTSVDLFDAEYFGIDEDEAPHLDPQQRLLLTCAAEAVADANLTRAELGHRRVGVFTGASTMEYHQVHLRNGVKPEELSRYVASGGALSGTAGRMASCLGLHGPALTVDTACSSMLTALHLACAALRRGECDLALVGACQLLLSPWTTAAFAQTGVLSGSGQCRPFAADADGYVRAEGCGVLVLQRQRDAQSDGALPHALVRGTAIHQHGDRLTQSMASALSQQYVIEQALQQAQAAPEQVRYVEAQANGSKLAGIVEIESLAAAYRRNVTGAPDLYVGSCKANLGYLETASGVAGLIKTIMALRHGAIPPQPSISELDPVVGGERFSIRVACAPTPWPAAPRRLAGVSAFGFTGTDAHAVLEAAADSPDPVGPPAPAVLALSGHNPDALRMTAARLYAHLQQHPDWSHAPVCQTLAVGRDVRAVRTARVVHDRAELLAQLSRAADGPPGPPPVAAPSGLALRLGELSESDLPAVLNTCARPGLESLRARLESSASMLGLPVNEDQPLAPDAVSRGDRPGWTFAWALAWIGLVQALRLEITEAELGGAHRDLLVDVITQKSTLEQACAQWWERGHGTNPDTGTPGRVGRWQVATTEDGWTLRRQGQPAVPVRIEPARLTPDTWLSLVADQFVRGRPVRLAALWERPRHGLVRLPPPAFTGRPYWPERNRWS